MKTLNRLFTDKCVSDKVEAQLCSLGYVVVRLPSFLGLDTPVSSHPDMLIYPLKNGRYLICRDYYEDNRAFFDSLGIVFTVTEEKLSPKYPNDILFDALSLNGTVYGKKGCVSEYIISENSRFVPVSQGYARCSVAYVGKGCAITADRGLYRALTDDGINTLLIRSGYISLQGYDTGFIGGAGGLLPDGRYLFFGDPSLHPDGALINKFLSENKISAVSQKGEPLCDNGGLILL